MQIQGMALRASRLIKEGEEILIQYVGVGRSDHFQKVFDCTCCWCSGRCNTGSHLSDSVWADTLEQTRQAEALAAFQRLERQIITDKSNPLKMRQRHPGKSKHTRPDRRIKESPHTTIWKGSGAVVPLQELLDIGKMDGMLNGCVINELLQWILAGKSKIGQSSRT